MLKMTKQRQQLLTFMQKQKSPMSAEMIYAKLPLGAMNLSTVYRILETFLQYHLVDKTFLDNTAYFKIASSEHKHYLVCLKCHRMIEMDCHFHGVADADALRHNFKITSHDLTVYGYCANCQIEA